MKKLMKFENSDIQMIQINGIWYFELYSIGMALGQFRIAKGKKYPAKDRIDKNAKNAEIKPVVRNAQPFITEEQLYDLMLETRTDKCRVFRKWLTNEVLPALNHEGTYTMKHEPKPAKEYEYFDKTYNGVPVLTTSDVEYLTGVNATTVVAHLRRKTKAGKDYYRLVGEELKSFKDENSKFKRINCLYVITREGFMKICRAYGIKIEEPKFFEMKAEKEKKYNPHKYVISLMGHIDRDTILINEYKNRLINSKTLREAEYNREMLLKAMCSLHGYELDTKSIILR